MSVASVGYSISPSPAPIEFAARRQDTAAKTESKTAENAIAQAARSSAPKPHLIESAANDLQKIGNAFNKKLRFEVDHNSNQVIVKVIDKDTDKVIRELPPEELQRLHQNLREAIGLLFDEMV